MRYLYLSAEPVCLFGDAILLKSLPCPPCQERRKERIQTINMKKKYKNKTKCRSFNRGL